MSRATNMVLRRSCRTVRRNVVLMAGAVLLASAAPAWAEPVPEDAATRRAARQLAEEGAGLFDKGEYAEAADRLRRAYELVPAPTIAVLEAKALIRLRRLVQAAERLEQASRFPLTADSSDAFRDAVESAGEQLTELQSKIPQLVIQVKGATAKTEGLLVRIDGEDMPLVLLGMRRPTNPGRHEVVATLPDGRTDSVSITLREGQRETITLTPTEAEPAGTGPQWKAEAGDAEADRGADGSMQRTFGWIALGIGGAGLATGAVAGYIMMSKQKSLDDSCVEVGAERQCPPELQSDVDGFRSAKNISWVGYGVGVGGVAVGLMLLLTAPSGSDQAARTVTPWVGANQLGVSGRF